ncbi:MAG: hypothetical protein IPO37_02835 [Saprospiraceae bacterium]|nr:hypothetical protein [Saprospiraceae bacterium]
MTDKEMEGVERVVEILPEFPRLQNTSPISNKEQNAPRPKCWNISIKT